MTNGARLHAIRLPATALALAALLLPAKAAAAAPGTRDESFGSHGLVFAGLSRDRAGELLRDAAGAAVVRQPGGQLVAAITVRTYTGSRVARSVALVRVTARGRLDPTFGRRGVVVTNLPGGSESATSIVRQPNGRIVVGGSARGRMLVLRYTPFGRLDRTFGRGGAVVVSAGPGSDVATALRTRRRGRILIAGQSGTRGALVQLRADGRLDTAFGRGGKLLLDLGPRSDRLSGLAFDRTGRILASGTDGLSAVLVRVSARGVLDRTFGTRGLATVPDATGHAVAIDSGGRALLTGGDFSGGGLDSRGRPRLNGSMVAAFAGNGTLDPSFGQGGVARIATASEDATTILIDPAGRPLIAGGSGGTCAFVARLSTAGALDPSFGTRTPTRGPSSCPPGGSASQVFELSVRGGDGGLAAYAGLLLQPDGRIVAVGSMGGDEAGQGLEPVIARYDGGG